MKYILVLLLFLPVYCFGFEDPYAERGFGQFPNSKKETTEWYQTQENPDFGDWKPGDGRPPWLEPGDPQEPIPVPLNGSVAFVFMLIGGVIFLVFKQRDAFTRKETRRLCSKAFLITPNHETMLEDFDNGLSKNCK